MNTLNDILKNVKKDDELQLKKPIKPYRLAFFYAKKNEEQSYRKDISPEDYIRNYLMGQKCIYCFGLGYFFFTLCGICTVSNAMVKLKIYHYDTLGRRMRSIYFLNCLLLVLLTVVVIACAILITLNVLEMTKP